MHGLFWFVGWFCFLVCWFVLKDAAVSSFAIIPLLTAIYTVAMAMVGGGPAVMKQCRTPDIMADAAYLILTKDSRSFTGNFCIDDEVLWQSGVNDLSSYSCEPGECNLAGLLLARVCCLEGLFVVCFNIPAAC